MIFLLPPIIMFLVMSLIGFVLGRRRFKGMLLLLFIAVFCVFSLLFLSLLTDFGLGSLVPSYLKVFVDIFRAIIRR